MNNKVYLALPFYDKMSPEALPAVIAPALSGKNDVAIDGKGTSILPHTFNLLFVECVNAMREAGYTHFAMMHADIVPPIGWLDMLIEEMNAYDADIISAVVALKDEKGLSTTGVWEPGIGMVRRFTMKEIAKFPKTFDSGNTGHPEKPLCVNTGLWVGRLNGWEQRFPGFQFQTAIITLADGKKAARNHPEDWLFSRWCHGEGLNVYATTAVPVDHLGQNAYPNRGAWGTWDSDKLFEDIEKNERREGGI